VRVFFDTNVLVSALITHGLCAALLEHVLIEHEPILGSPVREELSRNLTEKFHLDPSLLANTLQALSKFEQAPHARAPADWVIPDPDDAPIPACARNARADYFVTGDKPLLELRALQGLAIVSPRELWEIMDGK